MKNLLTRYIQNKKLDRLVISAKLKTDEYRRLRRHVEDRIRKNEIDFLRVCAALDIKQLGGE